jgi:hypothetical protein
MNVKTLIMTCGLAVCLLAQPAMGEKAICSSNEFGGKMSNVYGIEADNRAVSITYKSETNPAGRPAKILKHWFSGIKGSDALGLSFIMLQVPNSDGSFLPPSMIVIGWTTLRFAHSYMPYLAQLGDKENFILTRIDYECSRLD